MESRNGSISPFDVIRVNFKGETDGNAVLQSELGYYILLAIYSKNVFVCAWMPYEF